MIQTNVFVESLKKLRDGLNVQIRISVEVQDGIILSVVDWRILKCKIWTHWILFVCIVKERVKSQIKVQKELKEFELVW